MTVTKGAKKDKKKTEIGKYDLKGVDPRKALTRAQKAHFNEGMALSNNSVSADALSFERASKSVISRMKKRHS
jgi:hypothetical protein